MGYFYSVGHEYWTGLVLIKRYLLCIFKKVWYFFLSTLDRTIALSNLNSVHCTVLISFRPVMTMQGYLFVWFCLSVCLPDCLSVCLWLIGRAIWANNDDNQVVNDFHIGCYSTPLMLMMGRLELFHKLINKLCCQAMVYDCLNSFLWMQIKFALVRLEMVRRRERDSEKYGFFHVRKIQTYSVRTCTEKSK